MTDVPGCTNVLEYEIKVTNNDPIKLKSYPVPYDMIDQVDSEIEQMLKFGVIEESNSPYSSPFVIVQKKGGTNRFCIDFRALNRVAVFDAEPMLIIEDMFAKISGYKYWSKIDLCKGYWQIPLSMETKHYDSFPNYKGFVSIQISTFWHGKQQG